MFGSMILVVMSVGVSLHMWMKPLSKCCKFCNQTHQCAVEGRNDTRVSLDEVSHNRVDGNSKREGLGQADFRLVSHCHCPSQDVLWQQPQDGKIK